MKHLPFVLMLLVANVLLAEVPAGTAANLPVAADQTTPRGALKVYALAIQNADPKQLKDVLYAASPMEEELVAAMQRTAVAASKLRKVVDAKFGQGTSQKLKMYQPSAEDIAKVDRANEKIEGDKAIVTMADAPGQSVDMRLIKVNDIWKLTVAPMLPPLGGDAAKEAIRRMGNFAEALEATARDTEDSKFANIDEANGAIEARMLATAVPSTQPTTVAAPKK